MEEKLKEVQIRMDIRSNTLAALTRSSKRKDETGAALLQDGCISGMKKEQLYYKMAASVG